MPFDTVKVRKQLDPLQLKYRSPVQTVSRVLQEEGLIALYNGLPSAILRAGTIYAVRLGTFEGTMERVARVMGRKSTDTMDVKLISAFPVTFASMVFGNPFDVVKVRYQKQPLSMWSCDPRLYTNIVFNEGVLGGLYAGFIPNLFRNLCVGSAELVAYYQSKQFLVQWRQKDDTVTHILASCFAGLSAAVLGSPMDVVGTRVMQTEVVRSGVSWPMYAVQMARKEGIQSFYKGFVPNWIRLSSFNMVLWLSFEQIKSFQQ